MYKGEDFLVVVNFVNITLGQTKGFPFFVKGEAPKGVPENACIFGEEAQQAKRTRFRA